MTDRLLRARIVSYLEVSHLLDGSVAGARFRAGCFAQLPARLPLLASFADRSGDTNDYNVGKSLVLEDRPDGLVGTFAVHHGRRGDEILYEARNGYRSYVHAQFSGAERRHAVDGVHEITKARLHAARLVGLGPFEQCIVFQRPEPDLTPFAQPWLVPGRT